ncbi:MAG: MauE/DoxX family redox-associated membrane protein [Bacteroidia bacterium]|jgi:cation transport ATPase
MTHTYKISGMTCSSCQAQIQETLQKIKGVNTVKVDLQKGEAEISMNKHIDTSTLQQALKPYPKYLLSEKQENIPQIFEEEQRTWLQTYKPVLLIFAYITITTLLVQALTDQFSAMHWMNNFMAVFFLAFSFFKLLNLRGFADSYSTYDIIAKRWRAYGYLYAFIEFGLGIAYLTGFFPIVTNAVTLIVMSISIIGVLQSVLNKRKIKCACLGDVFNLPMSTITIIEDLLMILMSLFMLIYLFATNF